MPLNQRQTGVMPPLLQRLDFAQIHLSSRAGNRYTRKVQLRETATFAWLRWRPKNTSTNNGSWVETGTEWFRTKANEHQRLGRREIRITQHSWQPRTAFGNSHMQTWKADAISNVTATKLLEHLHDAMVITAWLRRSFWSQRSPHSISKPCYTNSSK